MSDELDARVRSLNAERQRPERVVELPDLLDSLIRALHRLYLTPPDDGPKAGIDVRLEEYAHLRSQGVTPARAAEQIGVSAETARRYEHRLRAQQGAA